MRVFRLSRPVELSGLLHAGVDLQLQGVPDRQHLHQHSLHCTNIQCSTVHYTALHCTALHCTALHITTLYCERLHSTDILYCILLEYTRWTFVRKGRQTPKWETSSSPSSSGCSCNLELWLWLENYLLSGVTLGLRYIKLLLGVWPDIITCIQECTFRQIMSLLIIWNSQTY